MDFFKSEYFFSNRTSSVMGKLMTVSYMIVFFYLTVQAVINVLNYSDKFFTKITSWRGQFDNLYYLMILYNNSYYRLNNKYQFILEFELTI